MLQILPPSPQTIPPPRPSVSDQQRPTRHICTPQGRFPLNLHLLSVTGPGTHGCSVIARRRHCCSTTLPLSHSRRPDWPGAALAPAQPGVPGPSQAACACASCSGGRLSQCLMAGFSESQERIATGWPWVLKVLENEAPLLKSKASRISCLDY